MLTGRALFAGDTVTDIIAAVVKEEPDLDALPAETPRVIRWLLARCLRKDPRTRLPDIGGARLDAAGGPRGDDRRLRPAKATPGRRPAPSAVGGSRNAGAWWRSRWWRPVLPPTLAFVHWTEVPEPRPAVRFTVDAPEGWTFIWPVPSPDGRHIVILAERDDPEEGDLSRMFWLHSLESETTRPLRGTEGRYGGSEPFWSPDSRFIGFFAEGELHKLNLDDDTLRRICALPATRGHNADWNEDGTILFGAWDGPQSTEPGGLYTVAATGGEPKPLLMPNLARGEQLLGVPKFLPDGRRFLFTAGGISGGQLAALGVHVGSLDRPDERRLLAPGIIYLGLAGGHVLFNDEDTLLAQPFDVERAELRGEPVAIASSLAVVSGIDVARFGVSSGGTLAYFTGEEEDRFQLTWLDRTGEQVGTVGAPGAYGQIAASPDERRVAVEIRDAEGQQDVWVIEASRGVASRLTNDPADENNPVWSPDGQDLAFTKITSPQRADLFRTGLHRGAPVTPLLESPGRDWAEDWSSDGETLFFVRAETRPATETSVWTLPLAGGGPPELVAQQPGFRLTEPQLSPDGRWLAYVSNESGAWEVYVEPYRRPGERVRVSVDGGGQPRWRGDGKELFYRKLGGPLMAVEVRQAAGRLEVDLPSELFDAGERSRASQDQYAVSADGQRFLVKLPVEGDRKLQMHVVVNWESLLE